MTRPETSLPDIARRMFDTPLMVEPGKAETIARAFGPRIFSDAPVVEVSGQVSEARDWPSQPRAGSILNEGLADHLIANKAGYIRHRGVAIIEVLGSLVRRGSWLGKSSGMTSYEGLRAQLKAAAADPEIRAIALEFDSPGGEAAGAFELADLVREIRATKPVYGFCAEYAFSAAYALASQCNRLTVPEFGAAGSIGVIMLHVDQSAALEKEGLKVTIIRAGEHKAEGNSIEPLPEDLRKEWQSEAEKMRVSFAELVGKGRGDRFDMARALKTEARCYSGPEAVRLGLADQVADPKKAFDAMVASVNETGTWDGSIPEQNARITLGSPGCETGADQPQTTKEADMADEQVKKPDTKSVAVTKGEGGAQASTSPETKPDDSAPDSNAKADAGAITALVARAGLPAQLAADMIKEGVTYAQASDRVVDAIAKRNGGDGGDGGDIVNAGGTARVTGDGVDRMKSGMTAALCAKVGLEGGERNEFSSMSLREMARFSLQTRNLTMRFDSVTQMVGAAFVPTMAGGLHTTSDFGNVLADVANKAMLTAYREAEENFEKFTKAVSVTDFKPTKMVGTGVFPDLDEVAEHGEFTYGSMGDFAESIVLLTYGKLFAISRQAVINDDLGSFTTIPAKAGQAAKRKVAALVYAILNDNPNMSDSKALFHADHGNLASSGAVPSEATIDAGLTAMAEQTPRQSDDADAKLNIQPKFLLAGYTNRSATLGALMSEKTPDTTGSKSSERYNTVYKAAEPIFDSRVSGKKWFLMADPAAFDTIQVGYLDGVREPFIDQQDGWTVDGTDFKVRLDAGAKAAAWEGLYYNPGE